MLLKATGSPSEPLEPGSPSECQGHLPVCAPKEHPCDTGTTGLCCLGSSSWLLLLGGALSQDKKHPKEIFNLTSKLGELGDVSAPQGHQQDGLKVGLLGCSFWPPPKCHSPVTALQGW